MQTLSGIEPRRVFHYFEEISAIPRDSGNMEQISAYCMHFAEQQGLLAQRDAACNVIIYKPASKGLENASPVILQGHLDMVCRKTLESTINFETDGIKLLLDGDYITADGTTLGADNGIAVAMILAILEDHEAEHPPIEAVFTVDEEIGMIGAGKLDCSVLQGRKLINLDAEEPELLTVSCAGGSDFVMEIPVTSETVEGTEVTISFQGLLGGHSGVEIHKGRINANMLMGRALHYAQKQTDFRLVSVNGGGKANAIPVDCTAKVVVENGVAFAETIKQYLQDLQKEISDREPGFAYSVTIGADGVHRVMNATAQKQTLYMLIACPNGVMEMSATIEGLVETSLNLGILKTEADKVTLHFALRSNKQKALAFLEEKLHAMASYANISAKVFGHYPPWEFRENSALQALYREAYQQQTGSVPQLAAIHAGLECGLLSAKIPGLDCIAIGPEIKDAHTVHEKISISSVEKIYHIVRALLRECNS